MEVFLGGGRGGGGEKRVGQEGLASLYILCRIDGV